MNLDLEADPSYLGFTTKEVGMLEGWMAYARSKLANVMSAAGQADELAQQGITCVSVHPGVDTTTELFRAQRIGGWIMRNLPLNPIGVQTTWQSVQTTLHCTLTEHAALTPGGFYSQYYKSLYRDGESGGWPMKSPNPLVNATDCATLVRLSREAVGLEKRAALEVAETPSTVIGLS